MIRRRSRSIATILLFCAAHVVARRPSRRRLENDNVLEKGRAPRNLVHEDIETWDTPTSDRVATQPDTEIDCIRRYDKGIGKGAGKGAGKTAKKSKSSIYFCSEGGGIPNEESVPLPPPEQFPSSESFDNPSAESAPFSVSFPASTAPSLLPLVAFTSAPTVPSPALLPSAENNQIPNDESSPVPSIPSITIPVPVAFPSADIVDTPIAESAPIPTQLAPSTQIPVALLSAQPASAPSFVSSTPITSSPVQAPAPTAAPSLPIASENSPVSVCDAFFAGNAPTSGPAIQFKTKLVLLLDGTVPIESVFVDMHDILTNEVAPTVLGCSELNPGESGRRIQGVVSIVRNVKFAFPFEGPAGVANIIGAAYYSGPYPVDLFDELRSAILNSGILGIPGLSGFGNSFEFEETTPEDVPPVNAPSATPTDIGALGEVENQGTSRESEQPVGAFVGVVIAGMVAALAIIVSARASRRRHSMGRQLKHQKLEDISTDDESNPYSMSDHDTSPDDGEDMWFANVIDDQDSGIISWDSQARSITSHRYASKYYPSKGMQFEEGLQYHHCPGTDCTVCWAETATRNASSVMPSKSRFRKEYLVHDTVVL